jgi:hypothetical protein
MFKVTKTIAISLVSAFLVSGLAVADTIITVKPELSLGPDGKAIVVNAKQFCPDATFVYIDTNTASGKAMYSLALSANAVEKMVHIQTACTCNNNCASHGQVVVFKMCTVLSGAFCD